MLVMVLIKSKSVKRTVSIKLYILFVYGWQNVCIAKVRMSSISVVMYAVDKLDDMV